MAVKLLPLANDQLETSAGVPAVGYLLYTYAAGSSTLQTTYTSSTGLVAQTNPVVYDSNGFPTGGEVWGTSGLTYKLIWKTAAGVTVRTVDNVSGINDSSASTSQWQASGATPTYISATSFSLAGDQTTEFHVGRRLQFTTTGGTVYGVIGTSTYGALTTIVLKMDGASVLDSGLSNVNLSILRADKSALPSLGDYAQSFRLTLTSAVPVTTADVTGATTIYCTPYKGNTIDLYDGTKWLRYTSAEFSLALGTLTSGKPYDVFCYANATVPTLEYLAWTDDTTRATALTYQDGVLVKTGALTRRYMGTFYTTSTTATEDSFAKRYLWNHYHRVVRPMKIVEATAAWSYSTASWRQANGSASNQINYVCGVSEDSVFAEVIGYVSNTSATQLTAAGLGIDSTTVEGSTVQVALAQAANEGAPAIAKYIGAAGVGRHYIAWLEYTNGGTANWVGTSTLRKSGLIGEIRG